MKKKSTSQSAFFNLRVLIGLFLALAGGSLLAFTGNYEYVGTAPKGCGLLVGSGLTCGWPMNTWSAQLATNTVQYTFAISQPAPNEFALFETHDPWRSTFIKDAITATGHTYQVFTPDKLAGFNFSEYRVVILNWDDTFLNEFITPYTAAIPALEAYVGAGGVVWVQAAIQGNPGDNFPMPFGGQGNGANFGDSDPIVDPASPMMTGIPNPIGGGPMSASHVSYTGLPGPAHTVVINPNNNQTVLYDLQFGGNCGGVVPCANKDFNGDCKADILWQNNSTGQRVIWLMNGTTFQSFVSFATVDTSWSIAGSGDFNGDGKADILWQNNVTGQRVIWLMNGTTFQSFVNLATVDTSWSIAGSGDFNGDGKADILWQNTVTGQRVIWLMNGTTFQSFVSFATVDTSWSIAGSGDFNGDGKADILWQNNVTGQRVIWLMNGTTFQSFVSFATVDTSWSIAGSGDFNGDGKADILWQNTVTGQRVIWLMNGTTFQSFVSFATVDTSWSIRNY